jgi:hypothetical protein
VPNRNASIGFEVNKIMPDRNELFMNLADVPSAKVETKIGT